MSLLVWLPLTHGLDNQGLSDTTFSYLNNNGKLVANASGKLGGCYERTASGYADTIRSDTNFNLTDDITMMCWAYVSATIGDTANGVITNHNHSTNTGVGITIKQISTSDYRICCNTGTGSSRTFYTYYGTTNIKNAWHHLALTYSRSAQQLKLWVDGEVEYTLNSYNNGSASNPFDLFNWSTGYYTNAQYRPVCKLNDVRLYDNCLSAKEIKEIAKGLVCHYKLTESGANTNLYIGTHSFTGTWGNSASWTTDTETFNGFVVKKRTGTWGGLYQNITATLNDVFTISFYAKAEVGANVQSIHRSSLGNVTTGLSILGGNFATSTIWIPTDGSITSWKYCWATVKITSADITYLQWRIENSVANKTMWITHLKIEKGDKPTSWIPNSVDSEYTIMGYDEPTVYDSSGLNNHMIAYGSPNISTNTIRNSVSTHFINGQYALAQANSNVYLPKDAITVNIWMNCSTWGNPISCTEGGGWNFENASAGIQFPCYISGVGYKVANSGIAANTLLNAWHMLTGVFDGTSVKIYIDAELKATTATGSTNGIGYAANRLVISGEAGGSTPASSTFVGEISDVRIYATALSAEDILELYQVGASIDKDGNMYAYEFNEV